MKDENKINIYFITYIVSVMVLAFIYFTVPERKEFVEFQIEWWKEALAVFIF